jgi:hypothetical protein
MSTPSTDLRELAIQRLRKRRDFHRHLLAYVTVNLLFVGVWFVAASSSDSWFFWPVFPMLGWGIGVVFHAQDVYGAQITEAQIEREMQRVART